MSSGQATAQAFSFVIDVCKYRTIYLFRESIMGRPVVHWEFWSQNPQSISDFYKKVFDWDIRHIPEMNYHLVETGGKGGINGGIMTPQKGPWPSNLALYIDVDDLDVYSDRITRAGGKIVVEKVDVPGVGQLSLFQDPDGRVLGMWKQEGKNEGGGT